MGNYLGTRYGVLWGCSLGRHVEHRRTPPAWHRRGPACGAVEAMRGGGAAEHVVDEQEEGRHLRHEQLSDPVTYATGQQEARC